MQDEDLLSVFRAAEAKGLSLGRQSYTWAVVAYKRRDRPAEALEAATDFSARGIKVRLCSRLTVVLSCARSVFGHRYGTTKGGKVFGALS